MSDTPLSELPFPVFCTYCQSGPFDNANEVDEHITEEHLPEAVWNFATESMKVGDAMSDEEKRAFQNWWRSEAGTEALRTGNAEIFAELAFAAGERRGMEKAAQRISHFSCGCAHVIRREISGEPHAK